MGIERIKEFNPFTKYINFRQREHKELREKAAQISDPELLQEVRHYNTREAIVVLGGIALPAGLIIGLIATGIRSQELAYALLATGPFYANLGAHLWFVETEKQGNFLDEAQKRDFKVNYIPFIAKAEKPGLAS